MFVPPLLIFTENARELRIQSKFGRGLPTGCRSLLPRYLRFQPILPAHGLAVINTPIHVLPSPSLDPPSRTASSSKGLPNVVLPNKAVISRKKYVKFTGARRGTSYRLRALFTGLSDSFRSQLSKTSQVIVSVPRTMESSVRALRHRRNRLPRGTPRISLVTSMTLLQELSKRLRRTHRRQPLLRRGSTQVQGHPLRS